MAIYYLGMKTFGRARGKSGSRSTSGAAYRAGERILDERTGHVYDHRRRADVLHKEIVLPARLAAHAASLGWARDRSKLWNAAEHAELRGDARVAREFTVALPHELAPAARTHLARRFAQEIADRYGSAVDVALHAPRGDARNFHAHLLSTTREVTPDGLGRKTELELSGTERHRRGLLRWREEIASLRERWAEMTNDALAQAHVADRVSHLSRAERGLEPAAVPRVPLAAYHMERRGQRSFVAERVRERHRMALEARGSERGRGLQRSVGVGAQTLLRRLGARMEGMWRTLRGKPLDRPTALEARVRAAAIPARAASETMALETVARERTVLEQATHEAAVAQARETPARGAERPGDRSIDEMALEAALKWRARLQERESGSAAVEIGDQRRPDRARIREHENAREHENDQGFGL